MASFIFVLTLCVWTHLRLSLLEALNVFGNNQNSRPHLTVWEGITDQCSSGLVLDHIVPYSDLEICTLSLLRARGETV